MRLNDKAVTFVTGLVLILGVGFFVHKGEEIFSPKQKTIQIAKADTEIPTAANNTQSKIDTPILPLETVVYKPQPKLEIYNDIKLVRAEQKPNTGAFESSENVSDFQPIQLDCSVKLSAKSLRGARVHIDVSAPCHSNKVVTIKHAGLLFNEYIDDTGLISITIPVLSNPAQIDVSFADGVTKSITTPVKDLSSLQRNGIAWSGHKALNLHANEVINGFDDNQPAPVSMQNKRSYKEAFVLGGGYLTTLGNPNIPDGNLIQIYTSQIIENAYVDFEVYVANKGIGCQDNLKLKTLQYTPDTGAQIVSKAITINQCAEKSENIVLKNLLRNMIVAQQN